MRPFPSLFCWIREIRDAYVMREEAALYRKRTAQVQEALVAQKLDGMVVIKPEHVRYLTGFWGYSTRTEYAMPRRLIALIVPQRGNVTLIVPKIEFNFAHRRTWISDVRYHIEWRSSGTEVFGGVALLDQVMTEKAMHRGRVGLEAGFLSSRIVTILKEHFAGVQFEEAASIIERLRMIKSPEEIAMMRVGAKMAIAELDVEVAAIRSGVREYEIAMAGREEATRLAAEYSIAHEDYDVMPLDHPINEAVQIITSGERLDMVHALASTRVIDDGDIVLLDFCRVPQLGNYRIGFSRNAALRQLTAPEREMFAIVMRSYDAALEVLKPGVPAEQPDLVAREILDRQGLGDTFVHRTGRGVGLEGVERPEIGAGDKTPLQPGMVVTIEPSVYFKNFAIHVEDTYLITEHGHECLTACPREFRILDDAKA
jgi:Xaa-Pro dipeptidase